MRTTSYMVLSLKRSETLLWESAWKVAVDKSGKRDNNAANLKNIKNKMTYSLYMNCV